MIKKGDYFLGLGNDVILKVTGRFKMDDSIRFNLSALRPRENVIIEYTSLKKTDLENSNFKLLSKNSSRLKREKAILENELKRELKKVQNF
ncbi:MAG: hypothetical protein PHE24_03525 [Patescibacteria group bacterium]|nr:hypothetical protein [Patescibacteria group bacterium]